MMRFALCLLFTIEVLAQTRYPERLMNAERSGHLDGDQQIALYQKMAARAPTQPHYQNLLASAYIQKVRETADFSYLDRASQIIDRVLASDTGNYEAMRLRSEIELERHHFAQAAEYSEELVKIAPEDPWNWGTLGDAMMELGQYERAATAYERMIAIRPDQSSYNRAAYLRFVSGDAKGAIALMQQAIASGSRAPENTAWCLAELGTIQFKVGRLDDAERSYRAAIGLFPGYHVAYAGLGRVAGARGRTAAAIETYTRAYASVPLPDYAAALEALYRQSGRTEEANQQLERIEVVDRLALATGERTNRNLAVIYADLERRLNRAMELVEEELKVRRDVYTYDALAWVLFKNRKLDQAAAAAQTALSRRTPEPGFYYHAGMIAAALGKKEEARARLARALELNPGFDLRQAAIAERTLRALSEASAP